MRILVIGSGGREHALVAALAADPAVTELVAAPGNPGIGELAALADIKPTDPAQVAALAVDLRADLVVIGPEAPLVAGAADAVRAAGIACFGPSAAAAQLEGSKAYAKQIMAEAGVPTAQARVCSDPGTVAAALAEFGPPYVVKDDGLAAGKGVVVTTDHAEALAHASRCGRVVIEEYLDGPEVSLFAVTDGTTAIALPPAQDFKRLVDGDTGPNTGGMGAYAPVPWLPVSFSDAVLDTVVHPTLAAMRMRGTPFQGLLYVGLALTRGGPRVVEFNARFGDPETQAILALLDSSLAGLLHAAATSTLDLQPPLRWRSGAAVVVVLAADGYPAASRSGDVIEGLTGGGTLLHAGTARNLAGDVVTAGGRVLGCVGTGADLASARDAAYRVVDGVRFDGMRYRRDIAKAAAAGQFSAG